MPRRPDPTIKPAIIERVTEHLRSVPLEEITIRGLGRVLGTSAYPIVYHFGSREALVEAVIAHLAESISAAPPAPDADAGVLGAYLLDCFGGLEDPDRALAARLVFELGAVERLSGVRTHRDQHRRQVDVLRRWFAAHGRREPEATAIARAVLLTARGIQWGFLLDGDAVAAERALLRLGEQISTAHPAPVRVKR